MRRGLTAQLAAGLVAFGMIGPAASVFGQEGRFAFRTGIEQTSGDYGGSRDFRDRYIPLTVLYERSRLAFRVTLPWLEVEFADPDGLSTFTESGLGDAVLGLTVFDVLGSTDGSLALDLTSKLKLGTADERKGLGTGETDYSLQADVYKFVGRSTLVVSAGYRLRGDTATLPLDDTWLLAAGGFYRLSSATSAGLFLDFRESSVPGYESIRELTASLSRSLAGQWRVQGYLVRGLSDTSLDWAAGVATRRDFRRSAGR